MINSFEILETIKMIQQENLDIRTITMGISLLDCLSDSVDSTCEKIYDKIYNENKEKDEMEAVLQANKSMNFISLFITKI